MQDEWMLLIVTFFKLDNLSIVISTYPVPIPDQSGTYPVPKRFEMTATC